MRHWLKTGTPRGPMLQKWPAHRALMALVEGLPGMLPTPTATAYGYNKGGAQGRVGPDRPSVDILAKGAGLGGSRLGLREWMMGWVIGWTALEPLAMDRFRLWLRLHGGC